MRSSSPEIIGEFDYTEVASGGADEIVAFDYANAADGDDYGNESDRSAGHAGAVAKPVTLPCVAKKDPKRHPQPFPFSWSFWGQFGVKLGRNCVLRIPRSVPGAHER